MNFRDMDSTDFAKEYTIAKKQDFTPYAKFMFKLNGYQLYFNDKKISKNIAFMKCSDDDMILNGEIKLLTAKLK